MGKVRKRAKPTKNPSPSDSNTDANQSRAADRIQEIKSRLAYIQWRKSINEEHLRGALKATLGQKRRGTSAEGHQNGDEHSEINNMFIKSVMNNGSFTSEVQNKVEFSRPRASIRIADSDDEFDIPVEEILQLYPSDYKLEYDDIAASFKRSNSHHFKRVPHHATAAKAQPSETNCPDNKTRRRREKNRRGVNDRDNTLRKMQVKSILGDAEYMKRRQVIMESLRGVDVRRFSTFSSHHSDTNTISDNGFLTSPGVGRNSDAQFRGSYKGSPKYSSSPRKSTHAEFNFRSSSKTGSTTTTSTDVNQKSKHRVQGKSNSESMKGIVSPSTPDIPRASVKELFELHQEMKL